MVSQTAVLLGCVGDYLPVDFARCEFAIYILGPPCNGKTGNLHHWWGKVKEGEVQQVIPDNILSKVYRKECIANV